MPRLLPFILLMAFTVAARAGDVEPSLSGSEESMERQNGIAKRLGLIFVRTPAEFPRLLAEGRLVALPGNDDYEVLERVSYPYARPEVRTFIENLAAMYRNRTGEKLVVTSLTRPSTRQPSNAHRLSVHPAGIAVDLRVSSKRSSSRWLEGVLLKMEREGLLDVTLEHHPPHIHVALFPDAYHGGTNVEPEETSSADPIVYAAVHAIPLVEDTPEKTATAAIISIVGDAGGDWMPLIAVLPLVCILLGAFGFRRKTRSIVPPQPQYRLPYIAERPPVHWQHPPASVGWSPAPDLPYLTVSTNRPTSRHETPVWYS